MSTNLNFASILDTPLNEIKDPVLLPVGTYRVVLGQWKLVEAKNEAKTTWVEYPVTFVEPQGNVDVESFEEFGGLARLARIKLPLRFFLTEEALSRARDFAVNVLGQTDESEPLKVSLQAGVSQAILVDVGHKPDNRNNKPRAEIVGYAPIE